MSDNSRPICESYWHSSWKDESGLPGCPGCKWDVKYNGGVRGYTGQTRTIMTDQEIFDRVVTHLRTQGKPAIHVEGRHSGCCAYRAQDGSKCAVGCLIPDSAYHLSMEGSMVENILLFIGMEDLRAHKALLVDLQKVHDNNHISSWEQGLAGTAKQYGLKYSPVTGSNQ